MEKHVKTHLFLFSNISVTYKEVHAGNMQKIKSPFMQLEFFEYDRSCRTSVMELKTLFYFQWQYNHHRISRKGLLVTDLITLGQPSTMTCFSSWERASPHSVVKLNLFYAFVVSISCILMWNFHYQIYLAQPWVIWFYEFRFCNGEQFVQKVRNSTTLTSPRFRY